LAISVANRKRAEPHQAIVCFSPAKAVQIARLFRRPSIVGACRMKNFRSTVTTLNPSRPGPSGDFLRLPIDNNLTNNFLVSAKYLLPSADFLEIGVTKLGKFNKYRNLHLLAASPDLYVP
jgi:hypothetical protein